MIWAWNCPKIQDWHLTFGIFAARFVTCHETISNWIIVVLRTLEKPLVKLFDACLPNQNWRTSSITWKQVKRTNHKRPTKMRSRPTFAFHTFKPFSKVPSLSTYLPVVTFFSFGISQKFNRPHTKKYVRLLEIEMVQTQGIIENYHFYVDTLVFGVILIT